MVAIAIAIVFIFAVFAVIAFVIAIIVIIGLWYFSKTPMVAIAHIRIVCVWGITLCCTKKFICQFNMIVLVYWHMLVCKSMSNACTHNQDVKYYLKRKYVTSSKDGWVE